MDGITDPVDLSLNKRAGDGEEQEGMIYCSPGDYEELEMTE